MKNLSDIVDNIHKQGATGATKEQIGVIAKAFVTFVTEGLKTDDKVSIDKLGIFSKKHRQARSGRNPLTGQQIEIKAKNQISFKAGKSLLDAVQ